MLVINWVLYEHIEYDSFDFQIAAKLTHDEKKTPSFIFWVLNLCHGTICYSPYGKESEELQLRENKYCVVENSFGVAKCRKILLTTMHQRML